ncbi:MAG: decaprenyl diphosphate synthase [Anaerocolumna sp.]|jgi:DeoR/GlpR family transcriptional regulator of sugar metabolism|nr:decaprenyl diphosphate synthase [Anaerocolumna sp.]
MKKVERINIIMRYINNRAHFTFSEILKEFNISRSTVFSKKLQERFQIHYLYSIHAYWRVLRNSVTVWASSEISSTL